YLDTDSSTSGLVMPQTSTVGTTTFSGEVFIGSGTDPEFIAAGARGNCFDIVGTIPNGQADLVFNFDVDAVTFVYGGNAGEITVEARNAAGTVVDSFFQADTNTAPAGPQTLAAPGIRRIRWTDPTGNFAALDNIKIHATNSCYANCDNSNVAPVLNVNDFVCFNNLFAAGNPRANCDGSTTPPVLNVNDFVCFNNRFAAGCN
ncbi:MAG: GC-type dockerin domain-anchored protein, partial [Phycisphaerales bacterium]